MTNWYACELSINKSKSMKEDIRTLEDIKLLVDSFYQKVQRNPLIGPIFIGVIKDNWPAHLAKMYRFWQTVLLDEHSYSGRPFPPHAQMPLQKEHFESWLSLFTETVDQFFSGDKAEEAKARATNMATMFYYKLEHLRSHPSRKTI